MKSRLHKIEIRNFKAFREFTLNLEGRHLLVYGDNGAGKSSLFWALYTFLQSARKPTSGDTGIAKYFDPAVLQNLLNIHEQADPNPRPSEIAVTLRDMATKTDTTYRIGREPNGQTIHGTQQQPTIVKAADRGKLKSSRKHLRSLLKDENWKVMENIKLIDEVLNTTERVLNPGAHGSDAPLYEHEVQKALDLIAKLQTCLA